MQNQNQNKLRHYMMVEQDSVNGADQILVDLSPLRLPRDAAARHALTTLAAQMGVGRGAHPSNHFPGQPKPFFSQKPETPSVPHKKCLRL
jgi:hypothetical protein